VVRAAQDAIRSGIGNRSFGVQVARANAEHGGGAKKTLAGAVQMFRELSHSTVALIAGKSEDADEDPEYLKVHVRSSPTVHNLTHVRWAWQTLSSHKALSISAGS
jgi:hypothetical protein